MMDHSFSTASVANLIGVHPLLVKVIILALQLSPVDFAVIEGVRHIDKQALLVERGASMTMNSKHLLQDDGYAHAVDLVPYRDGRASWNWPDIFIMTEAVREAAKHYEINLIWGGSWSTLNIGKKTAEERQKHYIAIRKKIKQRIFLDGPHFEIPSGQ